MDVYLVSLVTGAVGLGIMAVGGLSHGGHGHGHGDGGHGGGAGHGHAGDLHAGGGHGLGHGHGHAHPGDLHAGHGHAASHGSDAGHHEVGSHGFNWTSLLSPRLLFALMVGFGAGGIVATPLGEPLRFGAAILAAAAFELGLVGPLWRFLFRFESSPAVTLESAIEDEARAVTGFDSSGSGLVAVDVDGQVIQLLATLSHDERSRGVRIRSGDKVRIAEVDAARGRCIVTLPIP